MDLNKDGQPDLQQIKNWTVKYGNSTIPIGLICYNLMLIVIKLALLFTILHILIKTLNLC